MILSSYLANAVKGDSGSSLKNQKYVASDIWRRTWRQSSRSYVEPPEQRVYCLMTVQRLKRRPKAARPKKSTTRLSPKELRRLADRMVVSKDPLEVARLKEELERGFYGDPAHA